MKIMLYRLLLTAFACLLLTNSAFAAKVVIDPGHGGSDPGAIGVNGLQEKQVNLQISKLLAEELQKRGYDIVMTRTNDVYLSLQQRVEFTNRQQADLFISVHANSNPSGYISGTQVLYYDDNYPQASYPASLEMRQLTAKSKLLASYVLNSTLSETNMANKGLVPSAVYVVRMGKIPSILMETAFLSNAQDAAKLKDPEFQKRMAVGMANGIERFLPVAFKDLAGHWATSAIITMYENGYVSGVSEGVFEPKRALTRAEFIAMLDRVFHFTQLEALPHAQEQESAAPADDDLSPSETSEESIQMGLAEENTQPAADERKEALQLEAGLSETDHQAEAETLQELPAENSSDYSPEPSTGAKEPEQGGLSDTSEGSHHTDTAQAQSVQTNEDHTSEDQTKGSVTRSPEENDAAVQPKPFSDLKTTHWAYYAIKKAADLGLVDGYTDGTIRPDQPITRAEVAAIFNRVWGQAGSSDSSFTFADVPHSAWYAEDVYQLRAASILMGRTPSQFAPFQNMTRAEAAVMLYRFLYNIK